MNRACRTLKQEHVASKPSRRMRAPEVAHSGEDLLNPLPVERHRFVG